MTNPNSPVQRISRLDLLVLLPAFALLLLGALWAAVLYQVSQERASAIKDAYSASQSMARTFAEHTAHILRQADFAAQLFKIRYEESNGKLAVKDFTRINDAMNIVLPADIETILSVVDQKGVLVDSSQPFSAANVSAQEYFIQHAGRTTDNAIITKPLIDPASGKWHIQLSRRLNHRDGSFAGVLVLQINPAEFVDYFDSLDLSSQSAVVLYSPLEKRSIRRVGEQLAFSDQVDFSPWSEPDPEKKGPRDIKKNPFDQVFRFFNSRDLAEFSLIALVGLTEKETLAKYSEQLALYYWSAALVSALIIAFVGLLMLQSDRLHKSELSAQAAQTLFRAAAEGSLDAFFILKSCRSDDGRIEDFTFTDINERGVRLIGLPREQIIGQKLCELLPTNRSDGFVDKYEKVVESGQSLEEEFEINHAALAAQWLHHQIVTIGDGVAITTRDITERKKAELETRNNRSFLQSLIDYLPLLIYVKSLRPENFGQMAVWNKAAEAVTGYPAIKVIGKNNRAAFPPEIAEHQEARDRQMLSNPIVIDTPDAPFQRPDGIERFLHTVSVPLFDQNGQPEYILSIAEDVTQRREQEQALRKKQAELIAVSDASPLGLFRCERSGQFTYVNRTFESITGITGEQAHEKGWMSSIYADDRDKIYQAWHTMKLNHRAYQDVIRFYHQDGRVVWTSVKIAAILLSGQIEGFVGSIDDITARREADLALRESEARLRTIADTLPAMVAYIGADERFHFQNLAYERDFGLEPDQLRGKTVRETVSEEHYLFLEPFIKRVLEGETLSFEDEHQKDGRNRCLEVNFIPQFSEDGGGVLGYHVMRQDITGKKDEERRLVKLAQVDALTGLINRGGFLQKLADAMTRCRESNSLMALMYLDIDHFKPVNDTYGHHVGDSLLRAFSNRLTHTVRSSDTVARLGGDEFTIIMEKIAKEEDAEMIAAKIVVAMRPPFALEEQTVSVSTSVGLAFFVDGDLPPEALIKQADMMLYQAKQAGRNTYKIAVMKA